MTSFPANTEIFVFHRTVSFGCGIDGMLRYCKIILKKVPLSQAYFMFMNKGRQQIRILWYDGQGFALCTKRNYQGCFRYWPKNSDEIYSNFTFFQAQILFSGGDFKALK